MEGMDVEQSNRAPIAFRETCRAALYTILVLASPFLGLLAILVIVELHRELRMIAACCISAAGILALVRWINRRDAPRRVPGRGSVPAEDATAESN
jgi:hypothetical protein